MARSAAVLTHTGPKRHFGKSARRSPSAVIGRLTRTHCRTVRTTLHRSRAQPQLCSGRLISQIQAPPAAGGEGGVRPRTRARWRGWRGRRRRLREGRRTWCRLAVPALGSAGGRPRWRSRTRSPCLGLSPSSSGGSDTEKRRSARPRPGFRARRDMLRSTTHRQHRTQSTTHGPQTAARVRRGRRNNTSSPAPPPVRRPV